MRLSAPKRVTWWIAAIFGVLGIVANFVNIQYVSQNVFLFVAIGFLLLMLGTLFRGL